MKACLDWSDTSLDRTAGPLAIGLVQAQRLTDFIFRGGVWQVDLVAQDEERDIFQIISRQEILNADMSGE